MVSSKKAKAKAKGKGKQTIKHPYHKKKQPKRPKGRHSWDSNTSHDGRHETFPVIPDSWALAQVRTLIPAQAWTDDMTQEEYTAHVDKARTVMWESMIGFRFTNIPFLSAVHMAKIMASFNFHANIVGSGQDNLIRAIVQVLRVMIKRKDECCDSKWTCSLFFSDACLEVYKTLLSRSECVPPEEGYHDLCMARGLLSIGHSLVAEIVRQLAQGRRNYRMMQAQKVQAEAKAAQSKFDETVLSLSSQMEYRLSLEHTTPDNDGGLPRDATVSSAFEYENMDEVEDSNDWAFSGPPATGFVWPESALEDLCVALDDWRKIPKDMARVTGHEDWVRDFGPFDDIESDDEWEDEQLSPAIAVS